MSPTSSEPAPYLPPVMTDCVVDLSHYQRSADFARARAAGIVGAILKASQGTGGLDPCFDGRADAAVGAGLLLGAYHFLDASDAVAQADHFLDTVGEPYDSVLLALDLERDPGGRTATPDLAAAAASRIRDRLGRWPVLYVGRWTIPRPLPVLSQCPLWLPEYGADPICPPGWHGWHLWQHTDGHAGAMPQPVPGIGACDRSRFAGTAAQLAAWWGR